MHNSFLDISVWQFVRIAFVYIYDLRDSRFLVFKFKKNCLIGFPDASCIHQYVSLLAVTFYTYLGAFDASESHQRRSSTLVVRKSSWLQLKFSIPNGNKHSNETSMLIRLHFPVHIRDTHRWNTHLCMPSTRGCTVHHLACSVQPRGQTRTGQVLTFARVGWCDIVQNV